MTDRETLQAVAKGYHDLAALHQQQRDTMAKMLRACVAQLKSPNSIKRRQAIAGLEDLADMLDKKD